jgi:hypothetical protein
MAIKCKELVYTPINALSFRITGGTQTLTPHKIDNVIQSLEGSDGLNISLGLTIEVKKIKYNVNIIEETVAGKTIYYTISMSKRTKSSTFVMPMLSGTKDLYFWNRLFVNCFIATEEDKNCIALLYRWSSDPLFIKFEKALSKFSIFKRKYDPSPNYVMFIFDVPKKHLRNYKKFLKGQYSKFSTSYKGVLLDFHDAEVGEELGQILFKSPKRRKALEYKLDIELPEDSELLSIIDIEKETYNPEIYKLKKLL